MSLSPRQKGKAVEPNKKSNALSEIAEHGIEKYFQSIFTGRMVTRNTQIVQEC
jgi:hypothetical protein